MKYIFNFGLGIINTLFKGYILSKLWLWFIVPKFGLPTISYLEAVGLLLTIGIFTLDIITITAFSSGNLKKDSTPSNETDAIKLDDGDYGIIKSLLMTFVLLPLGLASAYIWHQFIH